jgi:hypothetical protein
MKQWTAPIQRHPNVAVWLIADLLRGGRVRPLSPSKQTIELTAAAHNEIYEGNVGFAIQLRAFAASIVNGNLGSTPALRGCHTIERFCDADEGQPSATNGHLLGARPMSAYMGRLLSRRFWLVAHYPFSCSSVLVS